MIIPDYVEKNARLYPHKTAVKVAGGRSCTFSELKERVYQLANGLVKKGLRPGDRVAVLAENCFEYPEMYLGIAKAGGVITPLNFRFATQEITTLVNESGARFMIVQSKYAELAGSLGREMKTVEEYVCIGKAPEGMTEYDGLLLESELSRPNADVGMDSLFCLMHTGGTTGAPKLTMLTHRNMLNCATVYIVETGFTYGDVFMIISPLFHTGAAWPLFWTFVMGNTFVILERFDIPTLIRAIGENKVTASLWMSQLVPSILNHPEVAARECDTSSLRRLLVGASVLPEPYLRRLMEMFPGISVSNIGGQTECGLFTGIRLEEHIDASPAKLSSVGPASFNMEVKVVDEKDREVPPEVAGELCVRGEGVMKGYWNRPEETARSLRGGWQHTGDICKMDEDGYLYYVDRLKDMIKSGGENVYSKEVEEVLLAHPAVQESAVIGVPDEKWGEAVKALVVFKTGQIADEKELTALCRERLASFKCPKSLEVRGEFPRTPLGKIDKKKLRQPYWESLGRNI